MMKNCEEAEFDLIRCNDDYSLNICSVGLDARIGHDALYFFLVENGIIRSSSKKYLVFGGVVVAAVVKDGPAERRRFIDMELSQLKPSYYYALQRYNRALKQRNLLLKQVLEHPALQDTLLPWEEQLAAAGAQIMSERRRFLHELNITAADTHAHVSGGRETLNVVYQPNLITEAADAQIKDALMQAYNASRSQDLRRVTTTVGPHRDDVKMLVNGLDVRIYGSQGQQRTTALSLKLSELTVMHAELGEWPVLMLDDVMSELDPERRRHLLSRLEGVQTLVTCTDRDDLAGAHAGKIYRVDRASLSDVPV